MMHCQTNIKYWVKIYESYQWISQELPVDISRATSGYLKSYQWISQTWPIFRYLQTI